MTNCILTATINGKNIQCKKGTTVLEAAKDNGIHIPSLCGLQQSGKKIHCDLCRVEINSEDKLYRACETQVIDNMSILTHSDKTTDARKLELERILSDHYGDCEAPCQSACPAGIDVQGYLRAIYKGNFHVAVKIIKEKLPLPLSIGRVCPAFCETECRRNHVDSPVAIRQLKRHAADFDSNDAWQYVPEKKADKGKKVAIIGGGPAGLTCGYYLSTDGYDVTVYESEDKPGGWLRYGIPEYRLPKKILDREIELICRNGMKIVTNWRLGRDKTVQEMSADFDVIYMAIGAGQGVPMRYEGSDLPGCVLGVDFLRDLTKGKKFELGEKVAVIGGGNTAIDCARTAVREGADVTVIYRRTREEMPAAAYEVDDAEHEGVHFMFLSNPVENVAGADGRVKSVKIEKMKLGEADASGRQRPMPTGEYFTEDFSTVIAAISQRPDVSFLSFEENKPGGREVPLTKWSTADADGETMYVGLENIFAIGDFRRGPATAVEAIADGRQAALMIGHFFGDRLDEPLHKEFNSRKEKSLRRVPRELFKDVAKKERFKMKELSPKQRSDNYKEVELGFANDEVAREEAERCLHCGCHVNTTCKLRNYATEYKIANDKLYGENRQRFLVDQTSQFVTFDANKCISCGQCIEICNTQSAHNVLTFNEGNPEKRVGFHGGALMKDSGCVQCGNCVQACPVGALTAKTNKAQGRRYVPEKVNTICTYCGVGCNLTLSIDRSSNRVIAVDAADGSLINPGMLCVKGRFGFHFLNDDRRLKLPLMRNSSGVLKETSWEEALTKIYENFSKIKDTHGADSICGFSSAKTTNEENYLFQKFMRSVIGTNNVDHCARLCHASTVAGLANSLGSGAMTNDIPGIKRSDAILIIGSDTTAAHPIIGSWIKKAVRENNAKLIVCDPKKISIADEAEIYVAQRPGTDVMLLNGIMHHIIKNDWQNDAFIAERCEDYAALKEEVLKDKYAAENVAKVTGVDADYVKKIAKLLAKSGNVSIYYAMGITQHTTGTDNVWSIANLQMLLGQIGRKGTGINPLRGQSNVQGACDMGALPNVFSGYQKVEDEAVRKKMEAAWGTSLPSQNGYTVTQAVEAILEDKVQGLYIMGENPVLSDPDQTHVIQAMEKVSFLVVQDIFLTETAKYADVVLPAAAFAEKEGHFTNTERRVQRLNKAIEAPGAAKADWDILNRLANKFGANWSYTTVKDVTAEINEVTPQYTGITWERTEKGSLQWPCPDKVHPGTPILHTNGFTRGKGLFKGIPFKEPSELPSEDYPMIMTTGRVLQQFHTGTMTRKTWGLDALAGPMVMISVEDAEHFGLDNGCDVDVTTRRGSITTKAFITRRMQKGVIYIPFHYHEAPANMLTIAELDPVAAIPEFKVCAAQIKRA